MQRTKLPQSSPLLGGADGDSDAVCVKVGDRIDEHRRSSTLLTSPKLSLPPLLLATVSTSTKAAIFSSQLIVPELPQDTDSFSEIDLNATSEAQPWSRPPTIDYNPLQDLEESDARAGGAGQLGDDGEPPVPSSYLQQTSAITAQFAAQLPNVASTVFSTFSRVIKGSSPAPPPQASSYANDPSSYGGAYGDSQPEFQSVPNPYVLPSSSVAPLINSSAYDPSSPYPSVGDQQQFGAQSAAGLAQSQPPPPPPTFYNPEQVPGSAAAAAAVPPPTAPGFANTYRLGGSKKKTYAHIPGLSTTATPAAPTTSHQQHSAGVAAPSNPFGAAPFVPPAPVSLQPEVSQPPAVESKSKPSLFGYLPTNILEKLPKPGFGGERKEEPVQFAGGISSGSIVDQFVELNAAPVEVQTSAPPPSALGSGTPAPITSFFAPPPAAAVPAVVPAPVAPQTNSFFAPNPLEAAEQVTSIPPAAEPATSAAPPPVFFSPAQVPTVRVAQSTTSKSNPYSSTRLASGIGRYKNPLAPIVPPAAGSVFLPNQPPPLSAVQPVSPASEPAQAPPSIFAPQAIPAVQPAAAPPISLFNPTASVTAPSERVEEHQQHQNIDRPPLVPTYQQQQVPPPTSAGLSPLATENVFPVVQSDPKPAPTVGSIYNPYAPQEDRQVEQADNSVKAEAEPLASTEQTILQAVAPPVIDYNFQQPSLPQAVDSVHSQIDSFNIGNAPSVFCPVAQNINDFPAPFLAAEAPSKPIVDSRSKSSENVLSPPPRPNSNLSEPAAIFPGAVPPADIFLPERSAQDAANPKQTQIAHDNNGNGLSSFFFATDPVQPAPVAVVNPRADAQADAGNFFGSGQPQQTTVPEPTPAINPVDFFNSNTLAPSPVGGSTVDGNANKTGQTISSVPLFSFFGRAADPAGGTPAVAAEVSAIKEHPPQVAFPTDPAVGPGEEPKQEPEAEQPAPTSSVSNVSSFSALNDRYEEEEVEPEQELSRVVDSAPNEPIFSSDNLFDFKPSAYQDGGFYSHDTGRTYDTYDGNSSMAAMATTSVGAPDTTTNTTNTGTSIAESSTTNIAYRPTYNHWFYRREVEGKSVWSPFTMADSLALEDGLTTVLARGENAAENDSNPPVIVHTDGGRYDVSIRERTRTPVYWKGAANEVRRCSWFYKTVDSRFVPYEEEVADLLEREYKEAATSGEWHRRVTIPNGETVVFHGPSVIVHFLQTQNPDAWGGGSSPVPSTTNRPRVVKRGIDEFNIDDDEPERIDHLLFMVHGIGEACDLRFRRVEEVVDEFRSISAQLVQSHYRSSYDRGDVGRVEILPISWHDDLHSEESGVDEKLKSITLPSIPKLRHFTNDTLLDVLFYTSPMFCQSIIDAVGKSLNRLYALFCQRNPTFEGRVSLAGHSLGSLILFDLLCHQKRTEQQRQPNEPENSENPDDDSVSPLTPHHAIVKHRPLVRKCSQQINYEVGPAGTGQPYITYPQLVFQPKMFFALGSPIGMFVTIRGIDALGLDFKLPTCDGFFNIFHPYDPVAYRIEALVNPELSSLAPVLIPHHKGRKRMHLELKETVLRVGNDLRQRVTDVFRNTLDTVYSLTAMGTRPDPKAIQKEVDKVLQDQLKFETAGSTSNLSGASDVDSGETHLPLGQLNQSRRVDYVLQEAPFEFINEYLFALTSHVCYWDSEDTMLFLMKEIYSSLGVQTDHQVPQQTMTIERPLAATSPMAATSHCSLSSNYNLFPQEVQQPAREGTL
uniref:DDHD domain-containing protein n=1 Tax=Anopheles dirus TaxID=7168 RepID=A0A182NA74_9DIPT